MVAGRVYQDGWRGCGTSMSPLILSTVDVRAGLHRRTPYPESTDRRTDGLRVKTSLHRTWHILLARCSFRCRTRHRHGESREGFNALGRMGGERCPWREPVAVLGDRWTLLILRGLLLRIAGSTISRPRLGITRHILANRLRNWLTANILTKCPIMIDRVRHEYRLTRRARPLSGSAEPRALG